MRLRPRDLVRATRKADRRVIAALVFLLILLVPIAAYPQARSDALAEVDGDAITAEEVEKSIGAPLAKLEEQIYFLKRQKIRALIDERLLARAAQKQGVSVRELLDQEVVAKVQPVTEQEIDDAYAASKGQVKGDETSAREQIKAQLREQKLATRQQAFMETLRSQAKIVVNLKGLTPFRAEVVSEGAPFKGPANARVTVVEFQDFHCPFCRQVQPALAQVVTEYGDRVKLVYRDFPIDQLHPQARKAHEAARCANDQGKFWAYHDVLFANPPKASPDDLIAYAREADLDVVVFERCLTGRTYRAAVQKDIEDGIRAGVTGTPTFFVNGRLISGAQPAATFSRVIDEELARSR